ncbi:MAG TPA: hypothetical protein VKV36_06415 [Acidimicrobiales bacterium]|nr:hypothetical protein [Acidimicrobiales bacterium]
MTPGAVVRLLAVVAGLLLLDQTVGLDLRVAGAHPELMWLLPVGAALAGGIRVGAVVGFLAGMAVDLVLPTPMGLSALVGCLLGAGVGRVVAGADHDAWWVAPVAGAAGTAAAVMLYAVLGAVLGQEQMLRVDLGAVVAVVAVVNALAARPVCRIMAWALGPAAASGRRRRARARRLVRP